MFAAVYQESYRYAEARARQIVHQRDNRTAATVSTEWSASTVTTSPPKASSRNQQVQPSSDGQRPPRRIILHRLDSNASSSSTAYVDDDDTNPTREGTAEAREDVPHDTPATILRQAREMEDSITHVIVRLEELETDLLKRHEEQQHDTILDRIARRIDHLEQQLCDLSSARRNSSENTTSTLGSMLQSLEASLQQVDQEMASYTTLANNNPASSLVRQHNQQQLSPILEPQPIDPALSRALDDDASSFSI